MIFAGRLMELPSSGSARDAWPERVRGGRFDRLFGSLNRRLLVGYGEFPGARDRWREFGRLVFTAVWLLK